MKMLKREMYLSRIRGFYDSDLIKILVGIRRCGKSVILKQIMEELKEKKVDEKHIIYVNFEFIEYEELQDYKKLNVYIKEKIEWLGFEVLTYNNKFNSFNHSSTWMLGHYDQCTFKYLNLLSKYHHFKTYY